MILSIEQLSKALDKASAFAAGEKNVPGIMLDIQENSVNICYADGRKALIENIDATIDEGDRLERVVVDYRKFVEIVKACQPSKMIYTDDVEITFKNDSALNVRVEKKIALFESEDSEPEYKVASVFDQNIGWAKADSSIRTKILSITDYDSIFNSEKADEWGVEELKNILDKTSTERNKIVYLSPKKGSAFVSNMAHLSCIPMEDGYENAIVISTPVAKAMYDILSGVDGEEIVKVHILDKRYCCIYTIDKRLGVWVEMAEPSRIHLSTLERYQTKEYKSYQTTIIRAVLENAIVSAIESGEVNKTIIEFKKGKKDTKKKLGGLELIISSRNTSTSTINDYRVSVTEYVEGTIGDKKNNIEELKLPVRLKDIMDILNKCETDYVGIDIDIDDNNTTCIRISELQIGRKIDLDDEIMSRLDLEGMDNIPDNEKLDNRDKVLAARFYTIAAR